MKDTSVRRRDKERDGKEREKKGTEKERKGKGKENEAEGKKGRRKKREREPGNGDFRKEERKEEVRGQNGIGKEGYPRGPRQCLESDKCRRTPRAAQHSQE